MFSKIKKFVAYLLGKKSEISQLGTDDLYMGKVIFGDIYAHKPEIKTHLVPLKALYPIHKLDRENSLKAVKKRAHSLAKHKQEILTHGKLDQPILEKYIPSVSGFRVIKVNAKKYFVFEGNGRLAAIKEVFTKHQDMTISVEEYLVTNKSQVIKGLETIRKRNQLS